MKVNYNRQRTVINCRLLVEQFVRPVLEHAALAIDCQASSVSIQNGLEILASEPLADEKGLPEQVQVAMAGDLPHEGYTPLGQRDGLEGDLEPARHALELLPPPILLGGQPAQAGLDLVLIDRVLEAL